jgi:hypothetical protein
VARQQYSPSRGEVLEPTEARQASPRMMNFRVLVFSTALIVVIFAGFVLAFLYKTPPQMDGTSQVAVPGPSNPGSAAQH